MKWIHVENAVLGFVELPFRVIAQASRPWWLLLGISIGFCVAWWCKPGVLAGRASAAVVDHRTPSVSDNVDCGSSASCTILAFGDVQQGPAIFSQLLDRTFAQANCLLGLGDMVQHSCPTHCAEWIPFANCFANRDFSRIQDIALALGNHDGPHDWWWRTFGVSWSFRTWGAGTVAVVILDSNEQPVIRNSLLGGGAQRTFLQEAVRAQAWTGARWRIAAFHHAPTTELWEGACYYPPRQELQETVALLDAAGCDLLLCGHAHGYQRGKLGRMLFVVSGGGGGWLDRWCRDVPEIEVALAVHHVLLVEATDAALTVRAIGTDGREIDRVAR